MSQVYTAGSGGGGGDIQNINGDTGTATGVTITFTANADAGGSAFFVASGSIVRLKLTDATANTFLGQNAGVSGSTVVHCTSLGFNSLTDIDNASLGYITAIGSSSGIQVTTGSYHTLLGYASGAAYTTEASNICIGYNVQGTAAESNTLRIGNGTGTAAGNLNAAYIYGIQGINVGSVASVVSISGNQLGTTTITAGLGITITPGANTITIASNGTSNYNYTSVNNAASPFSVTGTDEYIGCDVTAGTVTISLPNAPATGRNYVIKDTVGLAATNNITVTTVGGVVTIDGVTSFVMNTAYEAIQVIFNGTSYEVF